jgi:hypothetical protein
MDKDAVRRKNILAAASAMKIDLVDPTNAFMVWCTQSLGCPIFCGGRTTLNDAMAHAREFLDLKRLVVFSPNPKHGLISVSDDDRVKRPRKAHPGSGF